MKNEIPEQQAKIEAPEQKKEKQQDLNSSKLSDQKVQISVSDNSQPIVEADKVEAPPVVKKKKKKQHIEIDMGDNPSYRKLTCVVVINNSHHNMEVLTTHYSGAKVKTTFCSGYTKWVEQFLRKNRYSDPNIIDPIKTLSIHRMYYPEYTLFTLTEADWQKNEGKAWEVIRTKKQESWNDYPEFGVREKERPQRPKKAQNKL